ncbi:polyhydroxyalkanoate synthesis repressor PhaR [Inquilinus sp. Marseille-Q2685]|uniref:polyhydroxyalkanoate synthesis repressor PhaR n=1 Tax=Inquilinus sp. Marseille-Q2685 TaxID=2866581 RepID=UPI001CE460BE|nr:polyhydroxyalkanoate synthesis repressor PhaR [Inquilinus sp. Marseille-Q2685]
MPTSQAAPGTAPSAEEPKSAPITIKKYANRRLYNTATSSYVTLENLAQMVKDGTEFVVYDAKTGEDITRSVLTQIIVEEEGKGQNMLPIGFLRQLISLYGDNLQFMVPRYLESSMEAFARNQDQMRQYFKDVSGVFPFGAFEEMGKQNMALFERAMQMFTPFAAGKGGKPPAANPAEAAAGPAPSEQGSIDTLRQKLDDLQRQIEEITKPKR